MGRLPSPPNQLLFSILSLPRICILQPTFMTISEMPWTSCTERWVAGSHKLDTAQACWGEEGEMPPPLKETDKDMGDPALSRVWGFPPRKPHSIWNQPRGSQA